MLSFIVFIDIPADIQNAMIDEKKILRKKFKPKKIVSSIDSKVDRIIKSLKNSKNKTTN